MRRDCSIAGSAANSDAQRSNFPQISFADDRETNSFAVALFSEPNTSADTTSGTRLDKWLWAVRMFKTRALATDACRAGAVEVNQLPAKPARAVKEGELVTVKQGLVVRTLRVVGFPRSRVGAKLVPEFCTDLTPPEEYAKQHQKRLQHVLAREKGSGRPTKRDRRDLDRLFEGGR